MHGVRHWLQARGLGQYADAFEREQLDLDALPHLTEENLKDLGLPLGHRIKLLAAIRALPETEAAPEAPAAHSAARAERRQLTVMFCDLVGSTRLAEQLDPEELRELMRAYQSACAQAVARYDGHVAQYLGDGLMIYFGWPKAHEDDAERSVRAGIEIIEAVRQLSAPDPLQVRVGIATGDVVIGDTGAGDASVPKMAVGETPNLAARVQARAAPGEILVAEATRRLLGGSYELENLGANALKGFADPVSIWRVRGESRVDGRFAARGSARLLPLVGRSSELALLAERWAQALDGEGQVVLLSGEPGVGKSRIAYTLRQQIAQTPYVWVQYQCSPFFSNTALYPVIEQLKRAAGFADEDSVDEKRARLSVLLERAGGTTPEIVGLYAALLSLPASSGTSPAELSPQQLKARTIEAIISQYLRLAAAQPVLVMVEDVHWVDPTTQELLDQLVARVSDTRMLVLVTHRPEFEAPWGTQAHLTRLSLNRLSRRQCGQLAAQIAPKALPEALVAHIVDKADGVPLYVEEMTKAVLESDLLIDEGENYVLRGTLESLRIPATLHDSLMARLDRLLPVKEVAQIGAVIGREFDHDLLAAVAPMDASELDAALDAFMRSELIYQRGAAPQVTYVFKHALVQEAAYNSLLKTRRVELHRRIAEILETQFPDTRPEIIARHYSAANYAARAVPYWRKAGQAALAPAAYRDACEHFTRGLALARTLPPSPNREEIELEFLIALGEAQMREGGSLEPMKNFEEAAAKAEALKAGEKLAQVALGYAEASWRPGMSNPISVNLLQRANAALDSGDSILKARILAALALQFAMAGEFDAANRCRGDAKAMSERLGEPESVELELFRGSVIGYASGSEMDQLEKWLPKIEEIVQRSLKSGEIHNVFYMLPSFVSVRFQVGDVGGAATDLDMLEPIAERQRQPFYNFYVSSSRAAVALFMGRFDESERLAQAALALGQSMPGLDATGMYGIQMFSLRREQGRLQEVAPVLEHFVSTTPRESAWRPGLALIYAELGKRSEARAEFEQLSKDGFAGVVRDATWLYCMAMLAEVCWFLNDATRAALLYEALSPFAARNVVAPPTVACYGVAARQLGMLATTMGLWDEAADHFERALEANKRQGGGPCVAHTQFQYAQMLRARARPADQERIGTLLSESGATAKALGMSALAERIAAC